jgi:hypothetical protein
LAFDDLDLEFEDEEEAKKKKKEAVDLDVDLEFSSPGGSKVSRPQAPSRPSGVSQAPSSSPATPLPKAVNVQNLDAARAAQMKRPAPGVPPSASSVPIAGSSALKLNEAYDLESQQMIDMREQLKRVEFEAAVKVANAEFKTELLTELLSDLKLMEHQISQLLVRINAKHPDMKQEALMIKKILADFTAKKRK